MNQVIVKRTVLQGTNFVLEMSHDGQVLDLVLCGRTTLLYYSSQPETTTKRTFVWKSLGDKIENREVFVRSLVWGSRECFLYEVC